MNTEINISQRSAADDTELRSLEFKINSKRITTPIKAIETKGFYANTSFPTSLTSLNEIYFKFDAASLKRCNEEKAYSRGKNQEVRESKSKSKGSPTICLISYRYSNRYTEGLERYPTDDEIYLLTNAAYAFSDVTPIPSVPKMTGDNLNIDNFHNFLQYIDTCYEKIQIRNKKKILGYIPTAATYFVRKIVNHYLDKGINAFYIDFNGTMISSHSEMINLLKRELAIRGYEENNFLHFINVNYGKGIRDKTVLPARDLLGFGYGLDSLGGVHLAPKRNEKYYQWLKEQKDVERNSRRLLNRRDYGYYRFDSLGDKDLRDVYPNDALVPLTAMHTDTRTRLDNYIRIVNLQQQCKEANTLTEIVSENQDRTLDYFKTKKHLVDEDLKRLVKK
jgi:hypothetical protein